MNAQLNSINFQQFVNDNKGKLISFLHNYKQVSKVVVDVCGDYFTGKTNESDAKIDGFYYFSDCKMIDNNNTLISVLEKHKNVILVYKNSFNYPTSVKRCSQKYVWGINPHSGSEIFYDLDRIKQVITIVDGEWKIVFDEDVKEPVKESVFSINKALYSDEQKYKNIKTNMRPLLQIYRYTNYFTLTDKQRFFDILQIYRYTNYFTLTDKQRFFDILKEIYNHTYSDELYRKFVNIWENELKTQLISSFTKNRNSPYLKSLIKRFAEICKFLNPNCEISFLSKLNMTPRDHKVYTEIINTCVSEEFNLLENKIENKIENKNNFSSASSINIEYRGKPKTVQVINEYTHLNGKDYVLINDLTDNGKTKTLFKEYIKYL